MSRSISRRQSYRRRRREGHDGISIKDKQSRVEE
jgi:hypothetical protein